MKTFSSAWSLYILFCTCDISYLKYKSSWLNILIPYLTLLQHNKPELYVAVILIL
jgi:hypothetical protein